ncbi:MAG TPA: hypothetical protein VHT26_12835 [Trebonia sp.]|jgi:hypothetical protein|nr:hypothetical protein [Trebonia sp.]
MSEKAATREFGAGPLAKFSALVYTLLVTEGLFLLTTVPTLVLVLLLDHSASNLPLEALCLVPVGPAASAALFALHKRQSDLGQLSPAASFWRGYKLNAAGALKVFVPWLFVMTMVAMTLAHRAASHLPAWWVALLAVIALLATLWLLNALVITSLFAFRTSDVARLSTWFLGRTPMVTLGNVGIGVIAAVVTAYGTEAVTVLAGSVLCFLLLGNSSKLIALVHKDFIAQ